MLVYVDDLLVTLFSTFVISHLIIELCTTFSIIELGGLRYFLNIEATSTSTGLLLTQHKYIIDLLNKTNMNLAKPVKTPMVS